MIFNNMSFHIACLVVSYNLSFIVALLFGQAILKSEKRKAGGLFILLLASSFLSSYLIIQPINETHQKIIMNKQFMILNKDGLCKEVVIPHEGKNVYFSCDVLIKNKKTLKPEGSRTSK